MSTKRKTAHEKIMELREALDMPEEETDPEQDQYEDDKIKAAAKRMDLAGTADNYVKMFNRDPWTDEWLGPDPEPPDPFMPTATAKQHAKKQYKAWKSKYAPHLGTFHLAAEKKESKAVRKARKARKKHEEKVDQQRKYDIAWWWLEVWMKPKFAQVYYEQYKDDLEGLVDFCYEWATQWAEHMTYEEGTRNLSYKQIKDRLVAKVESDKDVVLVDGTMKFKPLAIAEKKRREYDTSLSLASRYPEIPDEYWDEFCDWADKHPIKEYEKKARRYNGRVCAAGLRRLKFLKIINKRNKGFRKNMMLHDPITGASFISEKKMKEHMDKQLKEYDKRRKALVTMVLDLEKKGQISTDMADHMMGDTKFVRDRVVKRYHEQMSRLKYNKKQAKKDYDHKVSLYKAKKKWYDKHGVDINAKPYVFDDEIQSDDDTKIHIWSEKGAGRKGYLFFIDETHHGRLDQCAENLYDILGLDEKPKLATPPDIIADDDLRGITDGSYYQIPKY